MRSALRIDGRGSAAEDERVRAAGVQRLGRYLVADELGIDPALADAPRDQLRVLPTEVDDEDGTVLDRRLRQRKDLSAVDSSATPS
jgi:hypothetical protein